MKSLWKLIALGALLHSAPTFAETNPAPAIAAVDFQAVRSAADLDVLAGASPCLSGIRQSDGVFDGTSGAWVASADLPFGQGALILGLNRDAIAADLALTMIYEETTNGDFVVQLWDAQNRILAADLFSNIIVAGREAKTDTFILDLARYSTATQVVLRRLQGEIRIYGLVLSPVACEVPLLEGCDAYELALQLDRRINAESELVQAAAQIVQPQGPAVDWTERAVQQPVDVSARNPYARAAFAAEDYPVYEPTSAILEGDLQLQFTASSLYAVLEMLRLLNAYHPLARGDAIHSLSSYQAVQPFLAGQTKICMMSIPMSLADRERFFRDRGYPVIEHPAALDPIPVIVHKDNPIDSLTIPQLDAIFGTELRAGAERRIQTWDNLGLDGPWTDRPITLWGGSPQTGTSRLFQQLVLQDGPFDPRLRNDPGTMYIGVLYAVMADPAAIGYLNAQNCSLDVKTLALAPQTGLPAYPPAPEHVYAGRYPLTRSLYLYLDAADPSRIDPLVRELLNLLYSRSGQEFFARSMQAPLPAQQVRDIRARLGL
ncbi:MAG: PstS family phosphate ABC transporter substrate-binding protein [Kiritimatiellia bacterium]